MDLTHDMMYNASLEKDISFERIFITAVKTTGIFCRVTYTARKPKKENVEFFKTTKEAIISGYRPFKVCKPMDKPNETPASIQVILEKLSNNPSIKFKDWDFIQRGREPNQVRRWFLKNRQMTFQAYQRILAKCMDCTYANSLWPNQIL